jgi:hypothetical protein
MLPDAPGESRHKGCPSEARLVVAVSLPRPGDGTAPQNAAIDPRIWTTRVIVSGITSSGASAEIRDYVVERSDRGWRFVRMKILGYWE